MARFFSRTRVRLTLVYAVLFLTVACVAAGGFWVTFSSFEYRTVDGSLRSQADLVTLEASRATGSAEDLYLPAQTQAGIAIATFVFNPDGSIAAQSDSTVFASDALGLRPRHRFPAHSQLETRHLPAGTVRVLVRQIALPGHETGGVILVRPIDELEERLWRTAITLIVGVAGLVVAAALLAYWLAGRALSPVREMSSTARAISEQHLDRRVKADLPEDDELGELASTFNGLLTRLEVAFQTLQRFTADAAHELRAPLALMKTQIEVMLRHPRTEEELIDSHMALLDEIERLTRLADQLLILARADAGALSPQVDVCDLPDLMEEVVDRWRPLAADRGITVDCAVPPAGRIPADETLIRRLLDNLLDNAFRHTPDGGMIRVAGDRVDGSWQLAVNDSGPGIPEESRRHLFERFYRSDPSRQRTTGGAGLGLSLCAAIAEAHGGSISVKDDDAATLPGACFVVELPGRS